MSFNTLTNDPEDEEEWDKLSGEKKDHRVQSETTVGRV